MPKRTKTRSRKRRKVTVQFTPGAKFSDDRDLPDPFTEFTEIPDLKKRAFLAATMTTPRIGKACKMAGISTRTAYDWRMDQSDVLFQDAYAKAFKLGLMRAESEMWRRGIDGYDEPVYHQGQLVGTRRVYSDTAAIFMLKGADPEKYAERRHHTGQPATQVQVEVNYAALTPEELQARLEAVRMALSAAPGAPGDVIETQEVRGATDPAERAYEAVLAARGVSGNGGGNGHG